jgi:hypothetical protein
MTKVRASAAPAAAKLRALGRRRGRPRANAAHAVPEAHVLDLAFRAFAREGYEGTPLRALASWE